ncbi:RCC1 domain-containing protein [Flavobacterium microcysteis]
MKTICDIKLLAVCFLLLSCSFSFAQCWKEIAAGGLHTIAIKTDGTLWAWGQNNYGQLGDGTTVDKNTPVQIGTATDWYQIAAGSNHSLAIKIDGTLWAWGNNGSGELGDGTIVRKNAPVRIGTATNWSQISGGIFHTLATKADGTLWAWGDNSYGQLGSGTYMPRYSPTQVGTDSDWYQIAAGASHTLATKINGSLWTWGRNGSGQLGDGTNIIRTAPVQLGASFDWAQIATKSTHTIAIKTDGTLWTWGENGDGQLGDGTTANRNIPVRIGTDTDWSGITAGWNHTLATKTDGTLWTWGNNDYAQLGDGTNTTVNVPIRISTASDWSVITAGWNHSLATKIDGALWVWGLNGDGELGDGTNINRNTPTPIQTNIPTISTSGIITNSCYDTVVQMTSLTYAGTTNFPTGYSIDWNATANTAGLADQADTPFTFTVGPGSFNTVTIPANLPAGTYHGTLNVKNCATGAAVPVTLTIDPASVGGAVDGGTAVCSGSNSGLLVLSGYTGSVLKWQSSVSPFSVWVDIAHTGTTYTSGILTETTQFRAEIQNGNCNPVFSTPAIVVIGDTTAPVADAATLPTITGQCSVTSLVPPTATDSCIGTVTGTTTALFPITSSTTITWTYTDGTNSSTQNQAIVIGDTTAPVADAATLPTITGQCSVTSLVPPTATDSCIGTVMGTTTVLFPITASTTITWTYSDGTNSSTQNQVIVIGDTTAPVADAATLPTITGQCSVTSLVPPTATDSCIGTVTGTTTVLFPITSSTIITWTYTDGTNSSTQNQAIVIGDTTAPVADIATLLTITGQCSVTSLVPPTATDNCIGIVTGTTTTTFPITASTTITWTYTDGANNSTQEQQVDIFPLNLVITNPQPVCKSDTVDITQSAITVGSTGNGILSYWEDADAILPLTNPDAVIISGIYYIKSMNGSCSDIKPVRVIIKELPIASVSGETICYKSSGTVTFTGTPNTVVTYTVDGGPNRTVSLGSSGNTNITTPFLLTDSTYQLVSVGYPTSPFCAQSASGSAIINIVVLATDFTHSVAGELTDNTSIIVTLTGSNNFILYQIDNKPPQDSNVFTNVEPGNHIITIIDTLGCTNISKVVSVIGYPKFFTPNSDGHNDYWRIIGVNGNNSKNVRLAIFDRYGKLLKLSNDSDLSWDGTYNGASLPSDDYWFTLEYKEDKQRKVFKSHFSLKR